MLLNKKGNMGLAVTLSSGSTDFPPSINNINAYYRPADLNNMFPEIQSGTEYIYSVRNSSTSLYGYYVKVDEYGEITNMPITSTTITGTDCYGPSYNNDLEQAIIQDSSGNCYVQTEITRASGPYPNMGLTIGVLKYNSSMQFVSGIRIWFASTYLKSMEATSITIDGSDNIYLSGFISTYISPTTTSKTSALEIKLDTSLTIVSYNCIDLTGASNGTVYRYNDVFVDSVGNKYYNEQYYTSTTSPSYGVVKINSSGVIQWHKRFNTGSFSPTTYNGSGNLKGILNDELYFVSDSLTTPSISYITKTDTNGNIIWQKTISASVYYKFDMRFLYINNGRIFIAGEDQQLTTSNSSYYAFIEIDSNGNVLDSVGSPRIKISGPPYVYAPYFQLGANRESLAGDSFFFNVGSAYRTFAKLADDWSFPRGSFKIPLSGGYASLTNYNVNIANVGSPTALVNYTLSTTTATVPSGSITLTSTALSSSNGTTINDIERYVTYMGT